KLCIILILENFQTVADICRKSVDYYSNVAPGIPYPYPVLTAFNGERNGMEFPGMINDQEEESNKQCLLQPMKLHMHIFHSMSAPTNRNMAGWMKD
ncbi:MAG: hypothetical protein U5L72_11010, partial [Bacteroidales bacterium]|nr:hypothetical protein [Bacteroidales bacterium]